MARDTASFMIGSIAVLTATEIFQGEGRDLSKGEQIPPDWPVDSREVHERLCRLAPILRTTKRQHPYREGDHHPCEEPLDVREAYTHVDTGRAKLATRRASGFSPSMNQVSQLTEKK